MRFFLTRGLNATILALGSFFPQLAAQESIPSWTSYSENHSLEATTDHSLVTDGKPSVRLQLNSTDSSERVSFFQTIRANPYLGHAVRITAMVRTANFKGKIALASATYDGTPYLSVYSRQIDKAVQARDWQVVELSFSVPSNAASLSFGLLFKGATGSAWLADVHFGLAESCKPSCASAVRSGRLTHSEQARQEAELKDAGNSPQNLDFLAK